MADMGQWSPAYEPARFPLGGIFSPLFITDKPDFTGRASKYLWDNFPAWQQEMKKNNLVVLNGYGTGPVQIAGTTKPIRTLKDIAGHKYRATAFLGEAWVGLGGVPVNVAGSEIYTSVATGTVEGVILALEHLNVFKLDEHLKFVAGGSGFGIYSNTMMAMNLDTWNSFEPELQKIILEARDVGIAKHAELASNQDRKIYEKFKTNGVEMFRISPAEAKMFKDKLLPGYWDSIKAKQNKVNPKFGEMMDMYAKLCRKWEGSSLYKDPFGQ
jgi:TRAP-type C4-dicarboxylate transport system substrate-binding protein